MWRMTAPDVEKLLWPAHDEDDEGEEVGEDDVDSAAASDDGQTTGPPLLLVLLVLTLFVAALPTVRAVCWPRSGRHGHHAHRPHPPAHPPVTLETAQAGQSAELAVQRGSKAAIIGREENANAARSVLECFQPTQPVLLPQGATTSDGRVAEGTAPKVSSSCTSTLMVHSFGNSYGQPFVGRLRSIPPTPGGFRRAHDRSV